MKGGLVTSLKRILTGLSSISKDNIHLLTPSYENAEIGSFKVEEGFTLHRYGEGGIESEYLYIPFMIKQVKKLNDVYNFDVIVAFYANFPLLIAGTAHEYLNTPYIICARGSDINVNLLNSWRRDKLSAYFSNASLIICNSYDMIEKIVKWDLLPREKTMYIRNSIDVSDIQMVKPPVKYDFLFVGTAKPVKRFDSIISALEVLKKRGVKAKLGALLMPHRRQEELVSLYKETCTSLGLLEYVDFIDPVAHKECMELFSKTKSIIVPSDSEGCSNIIMEAMAAGCRIIARSTSIQEHLIGEHNMVFNNNDELAAAMIKVAENPVSIILENRERVLLSHRKEMEFRLFAEGIDIALKNDNVENQNEKN